MHVDDRTWLLLKSLSRLMKCKPEELVAMMTQLTGETILDDSGAVNESLVRSYKVMIDDLRDRMPRPLPRPPKRSKRRRKPPQSFRQTEAAADVQAPRSDRVYKEPDAPKWAKRTEPGGSASLKHNPFAAALAGADVCTEEDG